MCKLKIIQGFPVVDTMIVRKFIKLFHKFLFLFHFTLFIDTKLIFVRIYQLAYTSLFKDLAEMYIGT